MKFINSILFILVIFTGLFEASDDLDVYRIVIDAGSMGTRLYVYRLRYYEGGLNLYSVSSMAVRIPLRDFVEPDKMDTVFEEIFDPLIEYAKKTIPEGFHNSTDMYLGATGGIRMYLGECKDDTSCSIERGDKLAKFYRHIAKYMSKNKIFSGKMVATTISITMEAVYGWLAANHLICNIDPVSRFCGIDMPPIPRGLSRKIIFGVDKFSRLTNTGASMEMGGASTQIVYQVGGDVPCHQCILTPNNKSMMGPAEGIGHWNFENCSYNLFHGGYEGFGMKAMKERLLNHYHNIIHHSKCGNDSHRFQCFAPSQCITVNGVAYYGTNTTNADSCSNLVLDAIYNDASGIVPPIPMAKTIGGDLGDQGTLILMGGFLWGFRHFPFNPIEYLRMQDIEYITKYVCRATSLKDFSSPFSASGASDESKYLLGNITKEMERDDSVTQLSSNIAKKLKPELFCNAVNDPDSCFYLSYFRSLLRDVYKTPKNAIFTLASGSSYGADLTWTLAMALYRI